eukprot:COSAG02_NODE_40628_length_403_cov_0.865132_1_plen_22_part_10
MPPVHGLVAEGVPPLGGVSDED